MDEWIMSVYKLKRIIVLDGGMQALAEFAKNNYDVDKNPRILSAYPIWLEWANIYKKIAAGYPAYKTRDYDHYRFSVLDFLAHKYTFDMVVKASHSIIKWKKELKDKYSPEAYLPELIQEMKDMNMISS